MPRITINPENQSAWLALRPFDVTSTESAALFGLSPYATAFELWHRKHDKTVVEFDATERMEWGTDLQDAIALSLARRYGVLVRKATEYGRITESRMGASFDFEITGVADKLPDDMLLASMFAEHGPGLLEIKNVDRMIFKDQWQANDANEMEAPGHIEIQVQHQLHVKDRAWAAIGVLVGGNTGRILVRRRDLEVGASLEARIAAFWQSVDDGIEPSPMFPGDAAFVTKLYGYAEPNKVFDGRGNPELVELAQAYRAAADTEKLAKEDKDVAKAKLLQAIGDAERAYLDGYTISAAMVGPAHVEYDRAGYRGWRLTKGKAK